MVQLLRFAKEAVITHYGVEKHIMKLEADRRLSGMFEQCMKKARARGIDILEIKDLKQTLDLLHGAQVARHPTTPPLSVVLDNSSKKVPAAQRFKMVAQDFQISKTYCVSSTPLKSRKRLSVKVCSHVFSSMVSAVNLTPNITWRL